MKNLFTFLCLVCLLRLGVQTEEDEGDKKDDVGTVIGIDLGTTYSW